MALFGEMQIPALQHITHIHLLMVINLDLWIQFAVRYFLLYVYTVILNSIYNLHKLFIELYVSIETEPLILVVQFRVSPLTNAPQWHTVFTLHI